jgi:hypothetical protein
MKTIDTGIFNLYYTLFSVRTSSKRFRVCRQPTFETDTLYSGEVGVWTSI